MTVLLLLLYLFSYSAIAILFFQWMIVFFVLFNKTIDNLVRFNSVSGHRSNWEGAVLTVDEC